MKRRLKNEGVVAVINEFYGPDYLEQEFGLKTPKLSLTGEKKPRLMLHSDRRFAFSAVLPRYADADQFLDFINTSIKDMAELIDAA